MQIKNDDLKFEMRGRIVIVLHIDSKLINIVALWFLLSSLHLLERFPSIFLIYTSQGVAKMFFIYCYYTVALKKVFQSYHKDTSPPKPSLLIRGVQVQFLSYKLL